MNKISCEVAKDLMLPYLDGICSEESRELVDGHLKECTSCRRFWEEMTAPEKKSEREENQIDFLKKINLYMKGERSIAVFLVVLLLFTVVFFTQGTVLGGYREYIYYVMLAPLAVTYSYIFRTDRQAQRASGKERFIIAGSFVNAVYIIGLQAAALFWALTGKYPGSIPLPKLGPFVVRQAQISLLIGAVMLVIHFMWFRKKRKSSIGSHIIIWWGIGMGLEFIRLLHDLNEAAAFQDNLLQSNVIMLAEMIVIYVICKKVHRVV